MCQHILALLLDLLLELDVVQPEHRQDRRHVPNKVKNVLNKIDVVQWDLSSPVTAEDIALEQYMEYAPNKEANHNDAEYEIILALCLFEY